MFIRKFLSPDQDFGGYSSEDELLGAGGDVSGGDEPTTPDADPDPTPQPPAPQVPEAPEARAFQQQRQYYENRQSTLEQTNLTLQQQIAAMQQQLAALQTPATPPEPEVIPDPVDNPKEFAAWAKEQAKKEALAELTPKFQSVEQYQQIQSQQAYLANYENSLNRAAARYGSTWEEVFNAAGLAAQEFPSVANEVFQSRDPGEALWRLGNRFLGRDPGTVIPQQVTSAPAMTEEQIRADERQKALQQFMAEQQRNPYNLAPHSITSLPAQVVTTNSAGIKPGSKEEADLLGS